MSDVTQTMSPPSLETQLQQVLGMVQALARSLERAERSREQSAIELRAHITAETDRLGKQLVVQLRQDAALSLFRDLVGAIDEIDDVLRLQRPDAVGVGALVAVRKRMRDSLARLGIVEITVERGTEFDPEVHEGVPAEIDEAGDLPPGVVVATMRAGYRCGDQLVRPARVTITS